MRVLITGGTGTISSGLVSESVNRGYKTFAITRGSNNKRNIKGAHYFHADIWDANEVKLALGTLDFDVVVECLAYTVDELKISLENFSNRCKQYVFVSTAGVYNRIGEKRIVESDKKEFTDWLYTRNKIACEDYLVSFSNDTGLKYTIIRPTVTYGDYRIPFPIATRTPCWTFFDRMQRGRLMLASDNVRFSVIHILDFSKMVVELFGNEKAYNEDFHITSNKNDIYWDDVIKISSEILGVVPKIIHVSTKEIKKIWPQIYDELEYHKNTSQIFEDKKVRGVTNTEPEITIEAGMQKIILATKKEFDDNGLHLDDDWNTHCDAVIYYSYKNRLLVDSEMKIVSNYISKFGEEMLKSNYKKVKYQNRKRRVKAVLKKIIGR